MHDRRAQPDVGPMTGRSRGGGASTEAAVRGSGTPSARPRRRIRDGAAPDGATSGATVAGYRLVRLMGKGTRCQVHLGRPTRTADAQDGPTNVAVKIVPATERSRGEAEILAMQAVGSEHVVALHDVATLADGSLCIVQSLGARGTAAALLGRRGSLTPGETVTLVASMLRGLGDLHEAGIAHGAVDLTHVVIDATGRPLLAGLGSSRVVAGDAGADGHRGVDPVEQDLGRVARIVQALRDPGDARGRSSADRWETWLALLDGSIHGESDLSAHDLAERLLDVADAAPLADAGGPFPDEDVDRVLADRTSTAAVGSGPVRPRAARTTGTRRASRLLGGRQQDARRRHRAGRATRADAIDARRTAVRVAVRRELASVRPRVWALGASALLLLVGGVVVMPILTGPASGATGTPTSPPAPSEPMSAVVEGGASPAASADVDAVTSPDPAIAAPALLRLRASCLRQDDAACVSDVDEAGSAVDDADRSTMARGGIDPLDVSTLHLADALGPAQRLGDTALIELSPAAGPGTEDPAPDAAGPAPERRPASLLMVRGEAGWRIRDLMDDR